MDCVTEGINGKNFSSEEFAAFWRVSNFMPYFLRRGYGIHGRKKYSIYHLDLSG